MRVHLQDRPEKSLMQNTYLAALLIRRECESDRHPLDWPVNQTPLQTGLIPSSQVNLSNCLRHYLKTLSPSPSAIGRCQLGSTCWLHIRLSRHHLLSLPGEPDGSSLLRKSSQPVASFARCAMDGSLLNDPTSILPEAGSCSVLFPRGVLSLLDEECGH